MRKGTVKKRVKHNFSFNRPDISLANGFRRLSFFQKAFYKLEFGLLQMIDFLTKIISASLTEALFYKLIVISPPFIVLKNVNVRPDDLISQIAKSNLNDFDHTHRLTCIIGLLQTRF